MTDLCGPFYIGDFQPIAGHANSRKPLGSAAVHPAEEDRAEYGDDGKLDVWTYYARLERELKATGKIDTPGGTFEAEPTHVSLSHWGMFPVDTREQKRVAAIRGLRGW